MKLLELCLHNFMPYYGTHRIVFPNDTEGNVVIFYGDNMYGKTSLLTAIKWALYRRAQGRHLREIDDVRLINRDATRDGDWHLQVDLKFEDCGNLYVIQRSIDRRQMVLAPENRGDLTHSVTLMRNGVAIRSDLVNHEINQILPETISRFSLFDGELLEEYEQLVIDESSQADRIKEKIEDVLGLPTLVHARDDLSVLLGRAQKNLARATKANASLKAQSERLSQLNDQKESFTKSIDEFKTKEAEIISEIEDLRDVVERTSRSESVKTKIDDARRALSDARREEEILLPERQAALANLWTAVISQTVDSRRSALETDRSSLNAKLSEHTRAVVEANQLAKSLADTTCHSCLQPLPEDVINTIRVRLEDVKTIASALSDIPARITKLDGQLRDLRLFSDVGTRARLEQLESRLSHLDVEKVRLSAHIEELLLQVGDDDLDLIVKNRQKLERLNRLLGSMQSDIKPMIQKLANVEKELTALSAAIAVAADPAARQVSQRVELLQALVEIFTAGIGQLRDSLRDKVETGATAAFRSMTTDKSFKGLKINSRYGLNIIDQNGEPVALRSAGAEQIVALSLIDGLSKATGKDAPLIMDTPFGRLDPRHRKNVLMHLPSMAHQVVLLVHEGEMDKERDMTSIASSIAAAYEIRRHTPSQSKIVKL